VSERHHLLLSECSMRQDAQEGQETMQNVILYVYNCIGIHVQPWGGGGHQNCTTYCRLQPPCFPLPPPPFFTPPLPLHTPPPLEHSRVPIGCAARRDFPLEPSPHRTFSVWPWAVTPHPPAVLSPCKHCTSHTQTHPPFPISTPPAPSPHHLNRLASPLHHSPATGSHWAAGCMMNPLVTFPNAGNGCGVQG
jgi:hypothetical protein